VWAQRFEELYRAMTHYFRARGFQMQRPEFPFVAIVFPRQHDFLDYAHRQNIRGISSHVLGFYENASNRIYLYDVTAGQKDARLWFVNAETIIHEAAHQTAFNTGLHSRFSRNPLWVVEGIGTMFEARGVFDPLHYTELPDRIHRSQLETCKRIVSGRFRETLASLVSSDRLFQTNATTAYAAAWGLSFYLSEREPRKYAQYLRTIAARPPYRDYSSQERIQDFMSVFGTDSKMLDARVQRFLSDLK
jgi:hypothetical protein